MKKRKKGDEHMPTITLKQLEKRVETNAKKSEDAVKRISKRKQKQNQS
ncbi:hypothetical protein [Psychrobacillus soli]|nr:hypothetical protein [Psychrobacillus soli]